MTAAGTDIESDNTPYKWRWYAFAIILVAEVMDLLDSTIVNIAAPSIRNDIGGSYSTIQWFAAAYTLAYAIGLIVGGRLGDIYGRRTMFIIGTFGFLFASIACSLSTSPDMLIIARVVQGLSGAMLIPQGLGMIRAMFPPEERAKAFAAFGPVMGLSAVLGPIIAGGLISLDLFGAGWRSVFWINVPLGLVSIVGAFTLLPHHERHEKVTLDVWGVILTASAMFLLVFPLVQGREAGWPLWTYAMIAVSLVLFGVFAWHEIRVERLGQSALILISLFQKRQFTSGLLFCALFFAMMSGLFLSFGLYCQIGLGFSALRAGLTQAPIALGIAIGAGASGSLVMKLGRRLMLIGLLVNTTGIVALLITLVLTGSGVTAVDFIPALLIIGIGMGMVFAPFFDIVLAAVSDRETGSASGTINAVQQFGGTLGIAIVATLFFSMIGSQAEHGTAKAASALDAQLTSTGIPASAIQRVHADFVNCVVQRTTAKDPTAASAECAALSTEVNAVPRAQAQYAGSAVGDEAKHGVRLTFTAALKHTIWLPIVMILLAMLSAFFLPKRARESDAH